MLQILIPVSSGRTLNANLFPVTESGNSKKPAALLLHGWTSSQDRMFDIAEMLSRRSGITCLTFDLSGHGKSDGEIGKHSRKEFLNDVIAAYNLLAAQPDVDLNNIGVIGSSFGGYLAALLTAHKKVEWLVMRVPADYPDEGFEEPKIPTPEDERSVNYKWRIAQRHWNTTDALRAIHNFKGKLLLVESGKDDIVPHQTIQNYADAMVEKRDLRYEIMQDAPHSLTKYPEFKAQFNELVFEWEKQKSGGAYTTILN
jgi:esterase/lipase